MPGTIIRLSAPPIAASSAVTPSSISVFACVGVDVCESGAGVCEGEAVRMCVGAAERPLSLSVELSPSTTTSSDELSVVGVPVSDCVEVGAEGDCGCFSLCVWWWW